MFRRNFKQKIIKKFVDFFPNRVDFYNTLCYNHVVTAEMRSVMMNSPLRCSARMFCNKEGHYGQNPGFCKRAVEEGCA